MSDFRDMFVYKTWMWQRQLYYILYMTRLDFTRTDTFFPAGWVVTKACLMLCLGNLWWYNASVPGTASILGVFDMSGQAHRLIASFGIVVSLLESKFDALVSSYVCTQSVFTDQRCLARGMRLFVDLFIILLALRAASRGESGICSSLFITSLSWAIIAGLASILEYSAVHVREAVSILVQGAAQPACALCIVVLAASTATSPCFSLHFQEANFSLLCVRTCLYTTMSIWRCYLLAGRPDLHSQHVVPNMALYGWVIVSDIYVVGTGVCISLLGMVAVHVWRRSSMRIVESAGLVDVKDVESSCTFIQSDATPGHIQQMDEELVQRLRSMESSTFSGHIAGRRRGGGMFT